MKIVIIGGGTGGIPAATKARRMSEDAQIVIYEKSSYIGYAAPAMPFKLSGKVKSIEDLVIYNVEKMKKAYNIDAKVNHIIIGINSKKKTLDVKNLKTGQIFKENYDKLIISTGDEQINLNIKGMNEFNNVFHLKTLDDLINIESFIKKNKPKQALIIGGSYIGLSIAENLLEAGMNVTVVEKANRLMPMSLDEDTASFIHKAAVDNKLNVELNSKVSQINDKKVILSSGKELKAEIIFVSLGVKPNVKMYEQQGIKIGETGGIYVDLFQKTSDDNIYAIGDIMESINVFGKRARPNFVFPGARQASIAVNNIFDYKRPNGDKDQFIGGTRASTQTIFGLTISTVGLNETKLQMKDIPFKKTVNLKNVGFSPLVGSDKVLLKVFYNDNFKILGAISIGQKGSEKRINLLSMAMHFNISYDKLTNIMTAYSPLTDSINDVVNMGSRIAIHQKEETFNPVYVDELDKLAEKGYIVVDVRTTKEFIKNNINGAISFPLRTLRDNMQSLDMNKKYIVYCNTGGRAYNAEILMKQSGFKNVKSLSGGIVFYNVYNKYKNI